MTCLAISEETEKPRTVLQSHVRVRIELTSMWPPNDRSLVDLLFMASELSTSQLAISTSVSWKNQSRERQWEVQRRTGRKYTWNKMFEESCREESSDKNWICWAFELGLVRRSRYICFKSPCILINVGYVTECDGPLALCRLWNWWPIPWQLDPLTV